MTKERPDQKQYEYTRSETIREFDKWAYHGGRLFGIDATISAVYWLERSEPIHGWREKFDETLEGLRAWLADDTPNLPDQLGEAALQCLRHSVSLEKK